jgi:hypothetical protein
MPITRERERFYHDLPGIEIWSTLLAYQRESERETCLVASVHAPPAHLLSEGEHHHSSGARWWEDGQVPAAC